MLALLSIATGTIYVDVSAIAQFIQKPSANHFKHIEEILNLIILYNLVILGFSSLIGYTLKRLVRIWKLDRKYKFFRFKNTWHYVLSGEINDFRRANFAITQNHHVQDIELKYVDLLIETQEGSILYDGLLVDYELSAKGEMETMFLSEVRRRYIRHDRQSLTRLKRLLSINKNPYYIVPGNIMSFSFDKVINMNISYYGIRKIRSRSGETIYQPFEIN